MIRDWSKHWYSQYAQSHPFKNKYKEYDVPS